MHTELISDGVMELVEAGVVTGVAKQLNRTKTVGTFALGTERLYDFLDDNAAFELWPVRYVNDPRVIAQESDFVSINATVVRRSDRPVRLGDRQRRVLLLERRAGRLRPRGDVLGRRPGVRRAPLDRQGIVDLQDRQPNSPPGDVVTTLKNTVDKVVTEWGVAELRGHSIRERADGADRHRPSRPPRPPALRGPSRRLPLTAA